MTAERNVELVADGIEAFNRGDLGAVLGLLAPDVAVHSSAELLNPGDYQGHEGFSDWLAAWLEAWESFRVVARGFESEGDDVIATVHQVASGRGSGLEVEMEVAYLFRFRDGAVSHFQVHPDVEGARAAARAP